MKTIKIKNIVSKGPVINRGVGTPFAYTSTIANNKKKPIILKQLKKIRPFTNIVIGLDTLILFELIGAIFKIKSTLIYYHIKMIFLFLCGY